MRSIILILTLTALFSISLLAQGSTAGKFAAAAKDAQAGNYADAIKIYRELLRPDTRKDAAAKLHFNIGVCLYHLKDHAAAIREFNAAIALADGKYQRAFYSLGMAHAAAGNNEKARAAFYDAVRLDENDGEAWFDLGMVLLRDNDHAKAHNAFAKAIENGSVSSADAHNNIGVVQAFKGDWSAAEISFERAVKLSAGASLEAAGNLLICRKYRYSSYIEMTAGLKMSGVKFTGE